MANGLSEVEPLPLDAAQKFEALRMRYEDHVELLRYMTGLDLRLATAVMSMQLLLGGWLAGAPVAKWLPLAGVLLLDAALVAFGCALLLKNARRRNQAIATLNNVMTALGFNRPGFYLSDSAINVPSTSGPLGVGRWGPWYMAALLVAYVGVLLAGIAALATA